MFNCNSNLTKVFFYLLILCSFMLFYYGFVTRNFIGTSIVYNASTFKGNSKGKFNLTFNKYFDDEFQVRNSNRTVFNIWCIFTKVNENSRLMWKFNNLITSAIKFSSVPLRFNIISDQASQKLAVKVLKNTLVTNNKTQLLYEFFDIEYAASKIQDIYVQMIPYFSSSRPGAYYSDALFYVSLGLYRIAPQTQDHVVMLDCDLEFRDDAKLLFDEFNSFKSSALFGIAPELSPVYYHVLHAYRTKHNTTFGEFHHPRYKSPNSVTHPYGYQGYNSGVVLFKLNAIRQSTIYENLFDKENVDNLTAKYNFKGHLGDQDFYTLMGYEYPDLFHTLPCIFNRQLCTWWKDRGYPGGFFDKYFKCDGKIVIYHGNCNTRIP